MLEHWTHCLDYEMQCYHMLSTGMHSGGFFSSPLVWYKALVR